MAALSAVMAGLDPAIHVLATSKKGVDARVKPGHDEENANVAYGAIVTEEKSTNQLFGCTRPFTFGLIARGETSCAT